MKPIKKLIERVDKFQQSKPVLAFPYAVIKKYGEDSAGYQAALLTYYGFLSLFPLLMVLTTIADSLAGSNPELQKTIVGGLTDYFPLLGNQLSSSVDTVHGSGFALLVGILFTLYGARGVADVWRHGTAALWGIPKDQLAGFPKAILKSFSIIVVGGVGLLIASVSTGAAAAIGKGWEWQLLAVVVNLVVLFWLFHFLLNVSLPKKLPLNQTRWGALTAAIGLVLLQSVGAAILAKQLKSLDALYSYFALALGLLFWIYLQAQLLYYAVEVAAVSSQKKWPRSFSEPPPKQAKAKA